MPPSPSLDRARGAANGHRVLESLYERPIISVVEAQAMLGVTYQAANVTVSRLEEAGILREITGQARHRRYRYEPYVALFQDDTETTVTSHTPGAGKEPRAGSGASTPHAGDN